LLLAAPPTYKYGPVTTGADDFGGVLSSFLQLAINTIPKLIAQIRNVVFILMLDVFIVTKNIQCNLYRYNTL